METTATNPDAAWQAIVAAAVLGAERAGAVPPLPENLAAAIPQCDAADAALLCEAAVLSVYRRAGAAADRDSSSAGGSVVEKGRAPSTAATEHLRAILFDAGRTWLLGEW